MKTTWRWWAAIFLGLFVSGCAGGMPDLATPARPLSTTMAAKAARDARPNSPVEAAVAYDDGGAASIRQTGGDLWQDSSQAFKRSVDKVAQAVAPASPAQPSDDPTSLSRKATPSPELYIAAAQVHEQSGRLPQAEQAFQQAFRLDPKRLTTQLAYARYKDRQKLDREALDAYLRASADHPAEAMVFNDLGLYYGRRSAVKEALGCFERAVQLQPKQARYRNNLAMLLVETNQAEAAMAHLVAVYPEAEACYKLGYLLQKKGDRSLALEYFGRALAIQPGMAEARAWRDHLARTTVPAGKPESDRVAARPPDLAVPPSSPPPQAAMPSGPPSSPPAAAPARRPAEVRPLPAAPRRLPQPGPEGSRHPDAPLPPVTRPLPPIDG